MGNYKIKKEFIKKQRFILSELDQCLLKAYLKNEGHKPKYQSFQNVSGNQRHLKISFLKLFFTQEVDAVITNVYNEFNSCKTSSDIDICFSKKEGQLQNKIKNLNEKIRNFYN